MRSMKLLVLGGSGQVGTCLMSLGKRRGLEMLGTYHEHPQPGLAHLNVCDASQTSRLISDFRPDWILHCASWTWVDGNEADPARARRENVDPVMVAAEKARSLRIRYVYFSSGYVFSGNQDAHYSETDPCSPESVYGKTKQEAEAGLNDIYNGDALILRTQFVYGPDPQEKNAFYQVLGQARKRQPIDVPSDQRGNPTFGPDLAMATLALVSRIANGVWHVAGPDYDMTRVAFTEQVCHALDLDTTLIRPIKTYQTGTGAPRPRQGTLRTEKLNREGIQLRSVASALDDWRRGEWPWPALKDKPNMSCQ